MLSSAFTALIFAAVLTGIGVWGRRNADKLVLKTLSLSAQQAKERSIRRGAVACLLGSGVFLALAIVEVMIWATRG